MDRERRWRLEAGKRRAGLVKEGPLGRVQDPFALDFEAEP